MLVLFPPSSMWMESSDVGVVVDVVRHEKCGLEDVENVLGGGR